MTTFTLQKIKKKRTKIKIKIRNKKNQANEANETNEANEANQSTQLNQTDIIKSTLCKDTSHIDPKDPSIKNNGNISLEITSINNLPNKLQEKDTIEKQKLNKINSPIINKLSSEIIQSEPHQEESIEYNDHYISFIVLYNFNYGFKKSLYPCNYLIGTNILLNKTNEGLHTYKIDITPEFKYKKFIRDIIRNEFNYKNKDISLIKSMGAYKNYHNYMVILNKYSKKHKQFKNIINDISNNYKWKQVYSSYPSNRLNKFELDPDNATMKDVYSYLGNTDDNIIFHNKLKDNTISLNNIYNILTEVV